MKKLFAVLMVVGLFSINLFSQEAPNSNQSQGTDTVEAVVDSVAESESAEIEDVTSADTITPEETVEKGLHQVIKEKFIEGGAGFMAVVIICLIFGLRSEEHTSELQ